MEKTLIILRIKRMAREIKQKENVQYFISLDIASKCEGYKDWNDLKKSKKENNSKRRTEEKK